jgi:predicted N-acetyltransferase YhbS
MAELQIRQGTAEDAPACARIFFDAFESIATRHAFPIEPGSPEFCAVRMNSLLTGDGIAGLVAEQDGHIVGSAFADERGAIVGIGPVSVDPAAQDGGIGRALMRALLERSRRRDVAGVRLVQTAYHYRSLSLYAKLGFAVREPLSVFQGTPHAPTTPGAVVRPATPDDLERCDDICRQVHGHDRHAELRAWINAGTARVVERNAAITGYATGLGYGWHAVGESDDDITALLGAAESFLGLGILVPSRNAALMAWCLDAGLRLVQQSTLMTTGFYNEPRGAYLPSILY